MSARLTVCPLRSGSSGNAVFIAGRTTRLLVDAGVSCRTIEQSLQEIGETAGRLNGLLVTHEHVDHVSGLGALMRRYGIPLYINAATWEALQPGVGAVDPSLVRLIGQSGDFVLGDLQVSSFATPHDAAAPAGYRIDDGSVSVTVMTDIGHVSPQLLQMAAGSRIVLIEANYDETMLAAGPYPAMLKQRVSSQVGHLSNSDCARAIEAMLMQGTDHFVLSHISKENNYPELALMTVANHLKTIQAGAGSDFRLAAARRFSVSARVDV